MKYASSALRRNEKSGKWRGLLKYKEGGKWRVVTKTLAAQGKRAALKELAEWREQMEADAVREERASSSPTVARCVAEYVDARAAGIEASSLSGYRTLLRNSIAPYIGDVPICELKPDDVEKWLSELCADRSRYTGAKALVLLRSALKRAAERGVIPSNPTRTVDKPKTSKGRPNSLDARERAKVAAYVEIDPSDPVSVAVRLALYTGMRRGEICALRWRNVDIAAKTLRVVESTGIASGKSIRDAADGAERPFADLYIKEPKTKGSLRTVAYPASTASALEARRARVEEDCLALGIPFSRSMFVCGGPDGKPLHPRALWDRWRSVVSALGLVGTEGTTPTFHDLRHTYATAAIASGVDVKTVSTQMGHSNAAMTLNTYASPDPDAARRAADLMGKALDAPASSVRPIELGRSA